MLSRKQLSRFRGLHRRRQRDESGEFLVEGVRLVEDLLASPIVPVEALISPSLEDTPRGRQLAARLRTAVPVIEVTDSDLARVSTTETAQGVVVIATVPRHDLDMLHPGPGSFFLALDAVQDPGNFGTVVRCADAFGATAVLTFPGTVDPWNPKSVRSAAGSSFRTPVVPCDAVRVRDLVDRLHGTIVGAAMSGEDVAAVSAQLQRPIVLVLGNEGAGVGAEARSVCDRFVAVPITGGAESLNVGVAAGILMYVLTRAA